MNMIKQALITQSSQVNGFKNTHAFLLFLLYLIGMIIDNPDSVYGTVKSTYNDLLASLDISPTTASHASQIKNDHALE